MACTRQGTSSLLREKQGGVYQRGTFSPGSDSIRFYLFSGLVLFLRRNPFDFAKDSVLGRGCFEPVD